MKWAVDYLEAFTLGVSFCPSFGASVVLGWVQVWLIWGCTCGGAECGGTE